MISFRSLHRDHLAGAAMVLLGLAAVWFAWPLEFGTLLQMGPGFFPVTLGALMTLVGVLIAISGGRPSDPSLVPDFPGEPDDVRVTAHTVASARAAGPDWRGWACILGAFVAFIVLFQHAGAVPATTAIALLAALAERGNSWISVVSLAIFANLALVVVFWWALRMPMHLFWWN